MALKLNSPCKINLLLNILGKRPDGFHELETVMHPIPLYDAIELARCPTGIRLSCSDATLPVDARNLVYRAADTFLRVAGITEGVEMHLEKRIPIAAGLGGGSGNAATTLLGLNQLFAFPATEVQLVEIATSLGSDVPFFLQNRPALATGRGEQIRSLEFFPALAGHYLLLVHPGFGISTPWAYQQLARYPNALHGRPGRAEKLISLLQNKDLSSAAEFFYNSLEASAMEKYPLLALFQEFFREAGATVALMSGSGSATFALMDGQKSAETVLEKFNNKFGAKFWTAIVPMSSN
ncbi:MAG: 4-(cytidine 5'-diphospho)-2-C-methyl-D-erythritol kinase [Verrucomicrobiota bacterium]